MILVPHLPLLCFQQWLLALKHAQSTSLWLPSQLLIWNLLSQFASSSTILSNLFLLPYAFSVDTLITSLLEYWSIHNHSVSLVFFPIGLQNIPSYFSSIQHLPPLFLHGLVALYKQWEFSITWPLSTTCLSSFSLFPSSHPLLKPTSYSSLFYLCAHHSLTLQTIFFFLPFSW